MEPFRYVSFAQEILFRPGQLARLGEDVKRNGWQRLMLCTSPSMRASGRAQAVEAVLGEQLVAVFDQVQPHVQEDQVSEAVSLAGQARAEAVIGMGGGSSIGMAKATAYRLGETQAGLQPRVEPPFDRPPVPIIAIPTTYAGSEMTAVFGITYSHETPPRKVTVSSPKAAPKLVLYDPELTTDLPPELTASTGINALAHCIEALYSVTRHPLSTAAAMSGIVHIMDALPACYSDGNNLDARSEMLLGAHLAGVALAGVKMGLHHGLCHVLGGTANVPHGIANAIILPHAVRFNARAAQAQLLLAARAMGIQAGGRSPSAVIEALAQKISDLTRRLGLPQRLRDAGVKEADLPGLALLGFQNQTVQNNPGPIAGPEVIERLLNEAW